MKALDRALVKEILTAIKSKGHYGSDLFNYMKENNTELDSGKFYLTVKSLYSHQIIQSYLETQANEQEKTKVKYKLSQRGERLLESLKAS